MKTNLREFGFIKLFRKVFKKEDSRHYILYLPDEDALNQITRNEFITIHDTHWGIETFHRAIKQVCAICRFMVRDSQAIKTHIFCSSGGDKQAESKTGRGVQRSYPLKK